VSKKRIITIKKIKKRSGKIVAFSVAKIKKAIGAGFKASGDYNLEAIEKVTNRVLDELEERFNSKLVPEVEQVQDLIEFILEDEGFDKAHDAFRLYRELHRRERDISSLVDSDELTEKYLGKNDWRVKENANMTYSLQGLNNHVASIISANFWMNRLYSREARKAHLSGDLHIHDLSSLSAYCSGWDLKDLLIRGFGGVPGKVNSGPPKHLSAALGQLVNFFYTLQGEVAGAVAVSNFDTYMAPFIRSDKLSYKEVKQLMQEFVYNMNVPTRVGFQTPFTNVTMDLVPTGIVADEAVIIGGKSINSKYKEYQKEIDIFNKAFAEVMMAGDFQGRVFTFPIPTYSITKDFDWDNSNLEPIWEMTRKYGIPYFSNYINSDMSPDDVRSMCCRLRLNNKVLRKRGGIFAANPLTGSIGVVTINLPRLGYLCAKEKGKASEKAKKEFFRRLGELMDVAKDSLITKRERVEKFTDMGLYPYCKYYLSEVYKRNGVYWRNHFNTIGINGMHEGLLNLLDVGIETEKGKSFALDVMDYMREKLLIFQRETGELFNLEATPAEGTSHRFARIDKQRYPDIRTAADGKLDKDKWAAFYTNSSQLPVDFSRDIFEALDNQDEFQCKYTGGTVFHGFLGEALPDTKVTKALVKKVAENYKLPYFSVTPTFSVCPKHGYIAGEHFYCPKCDEEIGWNQKLKVKGKK